MHFWDKDRAEAASKKLKRSITVFSSHTVEANNKVEQEQHKLEDIVYDIVDKKLEKEMEEQRARNVVHEKLKKQQRNKMEFPVLGGSNQAEADDGAQEEEDSVGSSDEEKKYSSDYD